jgi:hypothetical protein
MLYHVRHPEWYTCQFLPGPEVNTNTAISGEKQAGVVKRFIFFPLSAYLLNSLHLQDRDGVLMPVCFLLSIPSIVMIFLLA